jgi:hypothetical protein
MEQQKRGIGTRSGGNKYGNDNSSQDDLTTG